MKRLWAVFALTSSLGACTPGSFAAGGAPSQSAATSTTTIDVDLTRDPTGNAGNAGAGGGYAPLLASLAVGTLVRFVNSDGFAHTATSIAGKTFPSAYPFDGSALQQKGNTLSGGFSSGSLAAGAQSQAILADVAGTYVFGCYYHYGSPMRAAIVAR